MAFLVPGNELFFVEKVRGPFLVAEEKPVLASGTGCLPVLEERAERGDASSRTNHDRGRVVVGGWLEATRGLHEDFYKIILAHPVREKRGGDAFARATMRLVTHSAHCKMDFVRMRPGA